MTPAGLADVLMRLAIMTSEDARQAKTEADRLTPGNDAIPVAPKFVAISSQGASIPPPQTWEGGINECRRLLLEVAFGAVGAVRWIESGPETVGLAAEAARQALDELTAASALLATLTGDR